MKMSIELTEEEFIKLLKERIKKAKDVADEELYQSHVRLLEYYENCKNKGYIIKFYILDDSSLIVVPYSKNEVKLLEKKYREHGIW